MISDKVRMLQLQISSLQRELRRELLILDYDASRPCSAPLDVWGPGCWRKGEVYCGPFSWYDEIPQVIYQIGKARPTSREEGYCGDWSKIRELNAALLALDEEFPGDES